MYELPDEHYERQSKRFEKRDPELYNELRGKIAQKKLRRPERTAETLMKAMVMPEVAAAMGAEPALDAALLQAREAETIVRQNARPVMIIRDNRVTTEFLGPDSQVWANRITGAQAVLDRVIPAIGRVEVSNNPDYAWLGTGWLVDEDVIVTNRHVAREFARLGRGGFTFRLGVNGGPQSARMDFLEEYGGIKAAEFSVDAVLWIASLDEPDVAFLRVNKISPGAALAKPLRLAEAVNVDEMVATIGYPAKDPRVPDQDLVRTVFGDVYDKKRLAPGQVMEVRDDEMEHDCSTLGGNSGSPIVNLATGEVVGLHFSGVFLTANYAVPAPKLKDLLGKVQRNELHGMEPIRVGTPDGRAGAGPGASGAGTVGLSPGAGAIGGGVVSAGSPGTYTFRFDIPIEITVRVGGVTLPPVTMGSLGGGAAGAGVGGGGGEEAGLDAAVRAAREALKGLPGLVEVRKGYRFKRGWITDERVIVVEVRKKMDLSELRATGTPAIPPQILGFGVDVRTAALADQLESLKVSLESLEAVPRPGAYREPHESVVKLERVKERMKATFHVSPDSGFPVLRAFIGRVTKHLTATMYEWDVNHVSDAVAAAITPGRTLRMVTQKKGTGEAVEDLLGRLAGRMKHQWASVGRGGLIPSAYHIKVASRDGEEVWLSSGNWKDSNQPDIDPAGDNSTLIGPLRRYNREWHAVIANKTLATIYQRFIEWDFQEAGRVPVEELPEVELPDLFVPESALAEAEEAPLKVQYFDPLVIDRELDVTPLLTPDRDARGRRIFMKTAVALMKRANRTLLVQNQSFNLLEENVDEFEEFFNVLKQKQGAIDDVRIIFRDPREFGSSGGDKLQKMLERIKDFGIDTDAIRVQKRCHTKGIIVDNDEVLLGSHNLTNEGGLFNRDASLLVKDAEVAKYFRAIFEFDWKTLAVRDADEIVADVRVAQAGEATPPGFRRVSAREALGLN